MSQLYEDMMERYPLLYANRHGSMRETCMCWGIECGEGWYKIIDELSAKLTKLILELPEEERKHFRAAQVKEKFGTLRFYMGCETDDMSKAIAEAEDATAVTCETCGKPGKIRPGGWVVVRCDECDEAERPPKYPERPEIEDNVVLGED